MFRRRAVLGLIVALLLVVTACAPTDQGPRPKGVFYEVIGGENTLYLFGSVHVGEKSMYPLEETVEEAFAKADVLVLEMDLSSIDPIEMASEMAVFTLYQDGTQLSTVIGEELFAEVLGVLSPIGIPAAALEQLRPWYVAQMLALRHIAESAYSPAHGTEAYFISKAKGKQIMGLEEVADQLAPFLLVSEESQILAIRAALEEPNSFAEEIELIMTLWREGDRQQIAESLKRESALADQRDEKMAAKIAALLEDDTGNTYFVVVGYMHLYGENSIVDNLRKMGYEVRIGN